VGLQAQSPEGIVRAGSGAEWARPGARKEASRDSACQKSARWRRTRAGNLGGGVLNRVLHGPVSLSDLTKKADQSGMIIVWG